MERRRKGKKKNMKGGDRQTVINIYNYFKNQFPGKSDNYIVKETCYATCTSRMSFYRVKKKEAVQGPLKTHTQKKIGK
jgi:hypothetical protein